MKTYLKIQLIIIMVIFISKFNAAFGQATTGNVYFGTPFLGWLTSNDLKWEIDGVQLMQLNGVTNPGFFGIGTSFTPGFKLDVDNGDINLNTATTSFRIGGNQVLWHNGDPTNIFVGVNTGQNATPGGDNTEVGNGAGQNNIGSENVFVGTNTGPSCVTENNTLIGFAAGNLMNSSSSDVNTMVGAFTGVNTGHNILSGGTGNSYLGAECAYQNVDGSFNTYMGFTSAFSATGSFNSVLGAGATHHPTGRPCTCWVYYI